ncbi:sorbitol-specific phosphotransferase system component IIA [Rathayibacter sp. PhB127]|uniref:hypothetical protein n=1 Tax=Rathayibacter sp. PhB127 TaxID=2485176 RepID=UPI000F4C726F|nr:hypothetical protein [Rathayibacter sp. PhB127]ROS28919.1 sorbitol-specific phosphotransferase system component IIA [Rathayibacter sp. PhB127]
MTRKHDAWLLSRLRLPMQLAEKVFLLSDPGLQSAALPYVVVHPADGEDSGDRLGGGRFDANPSWTIHSVGKTVDQAKWAFELWHSRLVVRGFGVIPEIDGEFPGRVTVSSPIPVQDDADSNPRTYFHVAEVGFSSQTFV